MKYIQRRCNYTNDLETVDEFDSLKEASRMLREYRLSDRAAFYYISQRACKDWNDK